ncbi:carboxypeptidase-like regulatory domain-containing protein [Deinococcus koreensis]|uniref:Carboxypeptidase regulatory-like domain-containing protein n=1 Tax=Deinococcus koreensis TaxID=2054903 RepID=A0A2K3UZR0_9DEIO|nr:carboxypeptidase-like regulatory domain-containing protein [Deinococcus koreensis]PNY82005.1 hypothetical protein CVO96_12070 [Deinococcus koreensis]
MNRSRTLPLLALTGLILSACSGGSNSPNPTPGPVLNGPGVVRGIIVDQNIGAPVAGSTITVYQDSKVITTLPSKADGSFDISGLPEGTYDLKARKSGMAGSDVYGLIVGTDPLDLRMVQRPAFETSGTAEPATLTLTRADGTTPLAGSTFTDKVDFQITTSAGSKHTGPLRVIYAQLGRTPGSASVTGSSTDGKWLFNPPQDQLGPTTTDKVTLPNAASPNFVKGFGSTSGETVFMEILAVDFNYNYSRYIVPITLVNTSASAAATVSAPTQAAAISYTLKQEGDWTRPYSTPGHEGAALGGDAAPNGSGVFVEVRWCYTNTAATPFAFDIERSSDGTSFSKIGTVAGASDATACPANQLTRPFFYRDNSAALAVGKTFTYRVVARGANMAPSNSTATSPLAPFMPKLLGPADESNGVSLTPTFVIGNPQQEIGADGAGYNLQLRDLYTGGGYNLPGNPGAATAAALFRVEEGTGTSGNGVPAGQSLVFTSGMASNFVLTDTAGILAPGKPNLIPVDQTAHTVSIPLEVFAEKPLQTLRPYKWEMYAGYAYKYSPAEGKRVSAYSVYTWPASSILPIPAARPVNQNFDFITGQQ